MRPKILVVSLLAAGPVARSASASDELRFEYEAPADCPQQAEFRARVRERLLGASAEKLGTVVRVRVEPAARRASVELQDADGSRSTRAVQGDTCDELVAGAALITALAFGAHSSAATPEEVSPATSPAAGAAVAPESAAAPEAKPPDVISTKPALRKNGAPAKRVAAPRPRTSVQPERDQPSDEQSAASAAVPAVPRQLGWDAGAGGWVTSWLSPTRTLGADLFVRLGPRPSGWSARLSGLYGTATAYEDKRRADFSFWGGRLEGCPLSLEPWSRLTLEPCAAVELGSLTGTGREESALLEGAEQSVFWAAVAVVARLRAPLTRWVVLEAQAEFGLPIITHEFVFEQPDRQVFQVPNLGVASRLGLAVPFL